MFYRHLRKPIQGEAVQFKGDGSNDSLIASWLGVHPARVKESQAVAAHTLNGVARRVQRGAGDRGGDWLIRTKAGGLYVCPEHEFETHWARKDDAEIEIPKPAAPESQPVKPPKRGILGQFLPGKKKKR